MKITISPAYNNLYGPITVDETSYGKYCGQKFSLPGVACKYSGNSNGAVLIKGLIFSSAL